MGLDLASRGQELAPQIEERVKFDPENWRDRVAEQRARNPDRDADRIRETGRLGRLQSM